MSARMTTHVVQELDELEHVARALITGARAQGGGALITLQGDLGAGKTALTQVIARQLGITETVTSPTFVIMKSYEIEGDARFNTLTHIDAYRIDDSLELRVLGWEALLRDPKRLIVLEWPERVPELIPPSALRVGITIGDREARIITYGT
jgi:tRNA threonylcarbamoyladenosine biosynthesis protein TsaE